MLVRHAGTSHSSHQWLDRQARDPYVRAAAAAGYRARSAFKLLQLQESLRLLRPGDRVVDLGAAPGGWAQVAADAVRAGASPAAAGSLLDLRPDGPAARARRAEGAVTAAAARGADDARATASSAPPRARAVSILDLPALERAVVGRPAAVGVGRSGSPPGAAPRPPPPPAFNPGRGAGGLVVAVDLEWLDPLPGVRVILGDFCAPGVRAAVSAALGGGAADVVLSDMSPSFTGEPGTDATRTLALAWAALAWATARGGAAGLRPGGALVLKARYGEGYADLRAAVERRFAETREEKPGASRAGSAEAYLVGRGLYAAPARPAARGERDALAALGESARADAQASATAAG